MNHRVLEIQLRDLDDAEKSVRRAMHVLNKDARSEVEKVFLHLEAARRICIKKVEEEAEPK